MFIVSNRKEESISRQRVNQCVTYHRRKTKDTSNFRAASLAMQKNTANMFGFLVGICNIIYLYEFYLHT